MNYTKLFFALAATAAFTSSCQKESLAPQATTDKATPGAVAAAQKTGTAGAVYTLSNNAAHNQVLAYDRAANGALSFSAAYNTGGTGTGAGLGSQGALALSHDNHLLFAVNPGSNTISSFRVQSNGLEWVATVASGGTLPLSLTTYGDWLYVLNAGGTGNISGFTVGSDGSLSPLAGSTRPLGSSSSGPAQVSFVNDGRAVVVTEKAANTIISYTITSAGLPGTFHATPSANATPFGFAVGREGRIYVSEAAGGAPGASSVSSYDVDATGAISLVDGPVHAGQTAACWVAINNNNKYIYATNAGSNSISSFSTRNDLEVVDARAGAATAPIDAAFSNNSQFLYVLSSGSHAINAFRVGSDGSLTHLEDETGLPAGAAGLVSK